MIDRALFGLPGIKRILIALACFSAVESLVILGQAWSLGSAITDLWRGNPVSDQFLWIALFLFCFIGIQVVRFLMDRMLDRYAFQQADSLRQSLLQTIFSLGVEVVQVSGTGNTTTLLLEGVEQVETYLRLVLHKMIRLAIIPFFMLIPIFILDWVSGVILVALFPFIILYMVLLGRTAQERAAKQHRQFKLLSNHFIDTLRGIDTLKLFGVSKRHGKSIFTMSERFRKATIRTLRVATLSSAVLDLFATLSVAAVAIMLGLRLLDGSLVLFPALTVLILAPEYFKTIREFAADYHASLDGRNALSSILKMLAKASEDTNHDSGIDAPPCHIPAWSADSRLDVDNLSFCYDEFEALNDVSFSVSGLKKIGVIGTSGAGKSTLIHLLSGFSAVDKGSVCVDGTAIPSLRIPDWQSHVAYLPQNPYIFHATLRENISFYSPHASEEEVLQAAQIVGLEDLIAELPHGLDTRIGEGARSLSGGQAQRVALARVCLDKNRSILLFDEPTAHLDIETELELKQKMLPLMHNKLVFFATHRLHWMHDMDLILLMDEGKIVESGTLEELRARGSYFNTLVSQLGGGVA